MIERYELPVRLTANQNLILTAIDPSWKADILGTLTAAGVKCVPLVCGSTAGVKARLLGVIECGESAFLCHSSVVFALGGHCVPAVWSVQVCCWDPELNEVSIW